MVGYMKSIRKDLVLEISPFTVRYTLYLLFGKTESVVLKKSRVLKV